MNKELEAVEESIRNWIHQNVDNEDGPEADRHFCNIIAKLEDLSKLEVVLTTSRRR